MSAIGDVPGIFEDAKELHSSALERLSAGDIRDAAEKAWGATKRASDALILARTGTYPESTPETARGLRRLSASDPRVQELNLVARYFHVQGALHGSCFYLGMCDPAIDAPHIRRVSEYIEHAESLAVA